MRARPLSLKGKARLVNAMLRAHRNARRAAGIAIDTRAIGFYGLSPEEQAAWLGVVDWHLAQVAAACEGWIREALHLLGKAEGYLQSGGPAK